LIVLGNSTSGGVTLKRLERSFPDEHVILRDAPGRARFNKIEELGRRIDKNTAMLQQIIARDDANDTLVHALWEGARLVAWHQNARGAIVELSGQNTARLARDSALLRQQTAEREQTIALRGDIESQLEKLHTRLTALAEAGDEFIREQKDRQVIRRAQETLANSGTAATSSHLGMPDELAGHTLTLLQAYQELAETYGGTP
jgi:DNA repair exonuclease SbcCD ATPase subunit